MTKLRRAEKQEVLKNTEDKRWCVYMHINKTNGKKYIGQTCQNPKRRWANGFGYIESPRFWNAIQKYGWDNFEHIIVKQNLSIKEADLLEEELIAKFNTTSDKYGYNLQSGGMNKLHSEETKRKMSEIHKGRVQTEESKRKMSVTRKGMYIGKNNPKAHPIVQLTLDNIFIKNWDYISEAANHFGVNEASIRGCCAGKQNTSCGYKWMYREDYEEWIIKNKDL